MDFFIWAILGFPGPIRLRLTSHNQHLRMGGECVSGLQSFDIISMLKFSWKLFLKQLSEYLYFQNQYIYIYMSNRVSVERFQRDIFFSKTEAIYRYNYILKIRS